LTLYDVPLNLYSEEDQQFYDIEFHTVDNGGRYPGSFTKFEYEMIQEMSFGNILHLFSGSSEFGHTRIDLAHSNATDNVDVFDFLKEESIKSKFDTVIMDPPYNKKFAEKYAALGNTDLKKQFVIFAQAKRTTEFFILLKRINAKRYIMKSWNWYVPKGYKVFRCIVGYAGGYRKPTWLVILDKIDEKDEETL
jgi:hypothetical protein